MLRTKKLLATSRTGFTLIELVIAMTIFGIVIVSLSIFFRQSLSSYFGLQSGALALNSLYTQTDRVTRVLRGITKIDSASANSLTAYTYFYPSDKYVSKVHYYLDISGGQTALKADWTPMSADPPIGHPITSKKHTTTIISDFHKESGTDLFEYYKNPTSQLSSPVTNVVPIKLIKVNLSSLSSDKQAYAISLKITLRNKLT